MCQFEAAKEVGKSDGGRVRMRQPSKETLKRIPEIHMTDIDCRHPMLEVIVNLVRLIASVTQCYCD